MIVTLWVVFTISFILMRSVPGGPFDSERNLPPEVKRNIEAKFDFNAPLYKQYLGMLWDYVQFDFRDSYKLADFSVWEIIAEGFPVSASLGILALIFAIVLGLSAGVIAALFRKSGLDTASMLLATIGIAVPNFVMASLGILLFVFTWKLLPAGGWGSAEKLILPSLCLGLPFAAYIARLTRTGMLDVLGYDYIRTAKAKGLSPWRVVVRHALPGAILPVVSFLGPATAGILTGSLVLERIFALPGMGTHFIEAVTQRDYTLAMGMILVYTFLLFCMNTLVDISYFFIDPRVKLE